MASKDPTGWTRPNRAANDAKYSRSKSNPGASGGCLMALMLLPVTALMGALRKLAR